MYDRGTDPDPRFSLANERTFLAWVRTGLALLAGAAALDALDLPLHDVVQAILSALFALGGVLVAVSSFLTWAKTERAMREGTELPGNPTMIIVVIVVVVAGLVVGGGALMGTG